MEKECKNNNISINQTNTNLSDNSYKIILAQILLTDNVTLSIKTNLKILLEIIPEIKNMIGFEHRHPHHHLDVWEHTLLALSMSQKELKIRLVLLLHDIGKPHCYQDMDIRHFKGHAKKSSEIANNILTRLNFKENEITEICDLISLHDDLISSKLINDNKIFAQTLFKIQICDMLAHNPNKLDFRRRYLLSINNKLNKTDENYHFKELIENS